MHTRTERGRRAMVAAAAGLIGFGLMSAVQPASAAHAHRNAAVDRAYAHHAGLKRASNGLIAFVRGGRIYTVDGSGGDLRRLTPLVGNQHPHFSPDGNKIAYLHHTEHVGWNVWTMNADGTDKRQVTHLHFVTEAQWSPDGQWLVFGPVLSKIKATAPFGDPIPIEGNFGDGPPNEPINIDEGVDWSPDGSTIAYYGHEFPSSPDNYLLTLDLTTHVISEWNAVGGSCCGEGFFGDPAYSRDGKYLAYTHMVYFPEDGQHATRPDIEMDDVADLGFGPFPMVRGDKDPEFSPDGAELLFSHVTDGKLTIMAAALDGTGRHDIVKGTQPDWQPLP